METTETSLLILNVGVRFEQMGNADAESTVAPLPGKMATLHRILVHPVRNHLVRLLTCRCGSSYVRGRRRIRFSAGWREFELRMLQEVAAPLPERQCVFEH